MRLLVFAFVAFSAAIGAAGQQLLLPQPNAKLPQFEVATIKPASKIYIGLLTRAGGRIDGGNCTVEYLVELAFNVPKSMVSGGPDWVQKTKYDVDAIPPDDSPARKYSPPDFNFPMIDEQRLMLQALLRDRFALQYHVEKREGPVLFLRQSGKRLQLRPAKDATDRPFMNVISYAGGEGNGEMEGVNTTMAYTALRLSQILHQTVIDDTGLTGSYDFHVDAPEERDADIHNAALEGMKALGLELKPGKAPVATIVIDAVSPPSPN